MTFQPQSFRNTAIVAGARALLGGESYDRAARRNVDVLLAELERYEDSSAARARADLMETEWRAVSNALRHGRAKITREESELLGDLRDARILNIAEGTPSAGGFFVPTIVVADVLQRLKFYSSVASACKLIPTEGGAPWLWPTVDETAVAGSLLAEAATASTVDVTFGSVTLNAFKFTSGIVPVSYEILKDTKVDLASFLIEIFAARLGRVENTFFSTGTGTAQPQGIVGAAASGFVLPTGNTTTLTYDGLVRLYQSVDAAYRSAPGAAWMMNDLTLLAIKNLADTTNLRPLWLPDVLAQPPGSSQHGTLFGKPVWVNPDMSAMSANAKCALFGDMNNFAVRQVRGMAIMQLNDSAYASKGQVAFLAFGRADSRMISASNQGIKFLQNSAT